MSALRLVTSAARRAPRTFALGRRGYAEAADKINLSLVLPHQVRLPATATLPRRDELILVLPGTRVRIGHFHVRGCRASEPCGGDW